jgi:hypothetical protein
MDSIDCSNPERWPSWLKAAVSKTVVGVTPPGVQIPPSPPCSHKIKSEISVKSLKYEEVIL